MRRVLRLLVFVPLLAVGAYLAQENDRWVAPHSEKKKVNPVKADEASIGRGRDLYRKQCLSCHGDTGVGDGPLATRLGLAPGDLSNAVIMRRQTDGEIFWKIATGRAAMPGFKKTMDSTDTEIWDLVNFIRTLAAGPETKTDEKESHSGKN